MELVVDDLAQEQVLLKVLHLFPASYNFSDARTNASLIPQLLEQKSNMIQQPGTLR